MSIYQDLGMTPVINAHETITLWGGSIMPPEVLEAMREAEGTFVSIPELNRRVGERIALLTRNEAAFVTGGCAAALTVALAACITGCDAAKAERLPDTRGMKDEVVVHRCQRNPYDRALLATGARIVEFGYSIYKASAAQLESAISERCAAVFYFAGTVYERFALSLEQTVEIAVRHGVPVIVDAAAQVPPAENLWRFTERGASLALYSGGKGLRGPQNSGLVLGNAELIRAVEINAAPLHAVGRPMKTSKETIVGLLRAVELFLETDHQAEYRRMMEQVRRLNASLEGLSGIETDLLPTGRLGQQYPRGVVRLRPDCGRDREWLMASLMKGNPPVVVGRLDEDERAVYINPFGLAPGQEEVIADRIRALLEG